MLLAAGCSVDLPANDGETPLMDAAESNHAGTVKLLLEAGADKDAQNARTGKPTSALRESLLLSVDMPANGGMTSARPWSNHAGTVKLLLEAGADKDAQNLNGCNRPSICCSAMATRRSSRCCLRPAAAATFPTMTAWTPLMGAAMYQPRGHRQAAA